MIRRTLKASALALAFGLAGLPSSHGADYKLLEIAPGETKDLYSEFNLQGRIHVRIASAPGAEPCADFWWIKWPLGDIKSLGRQCGSVSFEIPGWLDFSLSAKLRVGNARTPLKIVASESATVANSVVLSIP